MEIMETQENPKNPAKFSCENCHFYTSHKNDYNKHLLTSKHKNIYLGNEMEINGNNNSQKNPKKPNLFTCSNCNKVYNTNSGLWKHKNICKEDINENNDISDKELIMMLVKQNSELLETLKNGTGNTTHTNSHNKTFNLQFFLNETCKDAMNIMDFVDKHPDCIKSDSKYSDQYNKLVVEAFGGKGDNDLEKEDKIIKNIAKEMVIDKYSNL